MTWRAAIGSFCCKLQVRSKVKQKKSALFTTVSDDTNTAKGTGISAIDVVISFLLLWFTFALVSCFVRNFNKMIWIDNVVVDHNVYMKTTSVGTDIESCVTPSVCQLAAHVKVLLSACCAVHALYPRRKLLLCPDVQKNPGPTNSDQSEASTPENPEVTNVAAAVDHDLLVNKVMQAMQKQLDDQKEAMRKQLHDQQEATQKQLDDQTKVLRNDLGDIKHDLNQVKQQCDEINKRCDRLENDYIHVTETVTDMTTDVQHLLVESDVGKRATDQLSRELSEMKEEIQSLKADTDRLEDFSRRDNLRFFGIPQERQNETYDACAQLVVNVLNSVDSNKQWSEDDVARAHRTGYAREGQGRPMLVKFSRWRDKQYLLMNKDNRQRLREKGISLASDLTRSQAKIVADCRKQGKRAYFQRGHLVIDHNPTPRTFADVVKNVDASQTNTHGQHIDTTHMSNPSNTGLNKVRVGVSPSTSQQPDFSASTQGGAVDGGGGSPPSLLLHGRHTNQERVRRESEHAKEGERRIEREKRKKNESEEGKESEKRRESVESDVSGKNSEDKEREVDRNGGEDEESSEERNNDRKGESAEGGKSGKEGGSGETGMLDKEGVNVVGEKSGKVGVSGAGMKEGHGSTTGGGESPLLEAEGDRPRSDARTPRRTSGKQPALHYYLGGQSSKSSAGTARGKGQNRLAGRERNLRSSNNTNQP